MPNSSDFSSATRRGFLATTGGVLAGAVTAPRGLAATVPQSDGVSGSHARSTGREVREHGSGSCRNWDWRISR